MSILVFWRARLEVTDCLKYMYMMLVVPYTSTFSTNDLLPVVKCNNFYLVVRI